MNNMLRIVFACFILCAIPACGGVDSVGAPSKEALVGFVCPGDFARCSLEADAKIDWNQDVAHCQADIVGDVLSAFCPMPVEQADCEQLTSEALVLQPSACSPAFLKCAQSSLPRYSQGCYVGHYACDDVDGTTETCGVSLGAGL